jgi:predicted TIM-barrel fold metal-dependent hydrolase
VLPSLPALFPYLPAYWREQISQTGFKGPMDRWHLPTLPTAARAGSMPVGGGPAASRLELIQRDVLQAAPRPQLAILHCDFAVEALHNPDAAAAISGALNEWLAAEWLAKEPRLRASIVVAPQFPDLAVAEIERRAGQPGFVQVMLPVRSEAPYGSRNFRPVFAAAARHGLPVVLHYGGAVGNPSTPVGWPSLYLEEYAGMTGIFQTQLISLIAGGVFDEFPNLKLVLAEGGFAWLPAMLWRFDKNWKGLRREIPWVRRPPSEYVREHVRLTIAPSDGPADPQRFAEILGQLGSDELLLYASDYPHEHGEEDLAAAWAAVPAATLARIRSGNAQALYGF